MIVGAPTEPIAVDGMSLIAFRRSIAGSANGGIPETQEMLDFCGQHGILPETELIDAPTSTRPTSVCSHSDVRYRFVIDINTLA